MPRARSAAGRTAAHNERFPGWVRALTQAHCGCACADSSVLRLAACMPRPLPALPRGAAPAHGRCGSPCARAARRTTRPAGLFNWLQAVTAVCAISALEIPLSVWTRSQRMSSAQAHDWPEPAHAAAAQRGSREIQGEPKLAGGVQRRLPRARQDDAGVLERLQALVAAGADPALEGLIKCTGALAACYTAPAVFTRARRAHWCARRGRTAPLVGWYGAAPLVWHVPRRRRHMPRFLGTCPSAKRGATAARRLQAVQARGRARQCGAAPWAAQPLRCLRGGRRRGRRRRPLRAAPGRRVRLRLPCARGRARCGQGAPALPVGHNLQGAPEQCAGFHTACKSPCFFLLPFPLSHTTAAPQVIGRAHATPGFARSAAAAASAYRGQFEEAAAAVRAARAALGAPAGGRLAWQHRPDPDRVRSPTLHPPGAMRCGATGGALAQAAAPARVPPWLGA